MNPNKTNTETKLETKADSSPKIKRTGWLTFALFLFELPIVINAFKLAKKGLSLQGSDLPSSSSHHQGKILGSKIQMIYQQEKKAHPKRKSNLAIAIIKANTFEIILCHFLEVVFIFLRYFAAYCLYRIIGFVVQEIPDTSSAYKWTGIVAGSQIASIYIEHHMYQIKCSLPIYIKGALTSMVYEKITKLSVYNINKISVGKLVNIVANDLNIFERTGLFFTHLITGLIGLVGGTALMCYFFNFTVLIGVAFLLSTLIIHKILTNMTINPSD